MNSRESSECTYSTFRGVPCSSPSSVPADLRAQSGGDRGLAETFPSGKKRQRPGRNPVLHHPAHPLELYVGAAGDLQSPAGLAADIDRNELVEAMSGSDMVCRIFAGRRLDYRDARSDRLDNLVHLQRMLATGFVIVGDNHHGVAGQWGPVEHAGLTRAHGRRYCSDTDGFHCQHVFLTLDDVNRVAGSMVIEPLDTEQVPPLGVPGLTEPLPAAVVVATEHRASVAVCVGGTCRVVEKVGQSESQSIENGGLVVGVRVHEYLAGNLPKGHGPICGRMSGSLRRCGAVCVISPHEAVFEPAVPESVERGHVGAGRPAIVGHIHVFLTAPRSRASPDPGPSG